MRESNNTPEKIYRNAIIAIELGIEDYLQGNNDYRRFYSSIRNLYSGLLLLFKSKLAEISKNDDCALIKPNCNVFNNNGIISWSKNEKKYHFKTIDYKTLHERLNIIGVKINWKVLDDLKSYRCRIEHCYDDELIGCKKAIGEYIARSFILIRDFCIEYLQKDPQNEFSEEVWNVFISNEDTYRKEIEERNRKINLLHYFIEDIKNIVDSFQCTQCGSNLITVLDPIPKSHNATDAIYICRNCGQKYTYKEMMSEYAGSMFQGQMLVIDDIAYDPIDLCPKCGELTYDTVRDICYSCGVKINNSHL